MCAFDGDTSGVAGVTHRPYYTPTGFLELQQDVRAGRWALTDSPPSASRPGDADFPWKGAAGLFSVDEIDDKWLSKAALVAVQHPRVGFSLVLVHTLDPNCIVVDTLARAVAKRAGRRVNKTFWEACTGRRREFYPDPKGGLKNYRRKNIRMTVVQ